VQLTNIGSGSPRLVTANGRWIAFDTWVEHHVHISVVDAEGRNLIQSRMVSPTILCQVGLGRQVHLLRLQTHGKQQIGSSLLTTGQRDSLPTWRL